jgi:plasmid stabilization system protein ParE
VNYTVTWLPNAEQELAAIWTAATDRNAVARASQRIDDQLEQDAPTVGESRAGGRRVILEPPLGAAYHIVPGTTEVQVTRVWTFRRRGRTP